MRTRILKLWSMKGIKGLAWVFLVAKVPIWPKYHPPNASWKVNNRWGTTIGWISTKREWCLAVQQLIASVNKRSTDYPQFISRKWTQDVHASGPFVRSMVQCLFTCTSHVSISMCVSPYTSKPHDACPCMDRTIDIWIC